MGLTLIGVGGLCMLITFPFIYGDPAPGESLNPPHWTNFTMAATFILVGLGAAVLVILGRSQRGRRRQP